MSIFSDTRSMKELQKISFSGYKKTEVIKQLQQSIQDKNIEPALNWCGELLCAGHLLELWNTIISYAMIHINLCNPRLPVYIIRRYDDFREIMKHYVSNELDVRNNDSVRSLLSEIIYILIESNKTHPIVPIKINKKDLNLTTIPHKLVAPDTTFAKNYDKADPLTLFIPVNELLYHVKKTKSMHNITFWIEWIIAYEDICIKNKDNVMCKSRFPDYIKETSRQECIWIIWEIIRDASESMSPLHQEIIFSLFKLFSIRYTKGQRRKKLPILYMAIMMICNHVDTTIKLLKDNNNLKQISSITEKIYKQINNNRIT